MRKLVFAALFVFAAAVAYAQTPTAQYKTDLGPKEHVADHVFDQRVYVAKVLTTDGGLTIGAGSSPLLYSVFATKTYDFPALDGVGIPCAESSPVAAPGVAVGDNCTASTDLGADGGAVLPLNALLSCRAALGADAGGVLIAKLCVIMSDGGSFDLADSGFFMRTFR